MLIVGAVQLAVGGLVKVAVGSGSGDDSFLTVGVVSGGVVNSMMV